MYFDGVFLREMHFVKKIPTTDDEKKVRRFEQEKKLKAFSLTRDRIFEKRSKGELDEEIMRLTEGILMKNPDIYTLWNIRREVLEKTSTMQESCGAANMEGLLNELKLSAECIKMNPKSYSAWFQRSWVLKRQSNPDLEGELKLCQKALQMDCRNFHCWDHRRIVAEMANRTDDEELEFSQKLVSDNFSNFSAWHTRMHLLPREKDVITGENVLRSDIVFKEIERVASAIFTDPEDESAWMFVRWIIRLYSSASCLNEKSACPNVPLVISSSQNSLTLSMCRSASVEVVSSFFKKIPLSAVWTSVSEDPSEVSDIWKCHWELGESIEGSLDGLHFCSLEDNCPLINRNILGRIYFGCPSLVIDSIRDHCQNLLEEDPKNASALLTLTECLRSTSPISSHNVIMSNMEVLASDVDPLRANMYKSFMSTEVIRSAMACEERTGEGLTRFESLFKGEGRLSLTYLAITTLSHLRHLAPLITDFDLRGNAIKDTTQLAILCNLSHLALDENPFEQLSPALCSLSNLEFLSIGSCRSVKSTSAILPALATLPSLSRFLYCETSLVDETESLRAAMGTNVKLIPHYL